MVMKFGGTSVGVENNFQNMVDIIQSRLDRHPIVVVSALGKHPDYPTKVTDMLINIAEKTWNGESYANELEELQERHISFMNNLGIKDTKYVDGLLTELTNELELINSQAIKVASANNSDTRSMQKEFTQSIAAYGELLSSQIIESYFRENKISNAMHADIAQLGIKTKEFNKNTGEFELDQKTSQKLIERFFEGPAKWNPVIVPGFIATDYRGNLTTLGRGASDYTASLIASAIGANNLEIWSDATFMSADPRIVEDAFRLDLLSYGQAVELAHQGAAILHPRAIGPAQQANIQINCLNTKDPLAAGTTIGNYNDLAFAGVTSRELPGPLINVYSPEMIDTPNVLSKILGHPFTPGVDAVATGAASISYSPENNFKWGVKWLPEQYQKLIPGADVSAFPEVSSVAVVGKDVHRPGQIAKVFDSIDKIGIQNVEMISKGPSTGSLNLIMHSGYTPKVVKAIHNALKSS